MVKVGAKISAEAKSMALLLQKNSAKPLSYREIARRCKLSKSKVHHVCCCRKAKPQKQPAKKKGGRPRNVNKRGIRGLIRTTEKVRRDNANLTVKQLRKNAEISHLASRSMSMSMRSLTEIEVCVKHEAKAQGKS